MRHTDVYQVLSAVIIHEIGHLLLGGENAHAHQGIMIAYWGQKEFELLSIGELRFTSRQATELRDVLRRRSF